MKELAPPGSYTLSGHDSSSLAGKSREDVAGARFSTNQCVAESSASAAHRKWPINFIREIVVDGYWSYPAEQGDSYFSWNDEFEPIHEQFSRALNGLLCSLDRLDSFTWKIVNTISPVVALTLSRFDSLKTLDVVCDTHMVAGSVTPNGSVPTLVMVDPSPLYYNSLKTLRLLQIGDQNHAVLFGDIMRSPTNWKSLRHIEVDLSLGFMKALMEMDPVVPDILFALFRPPPPARGSLESPKLALESVRLKDIAFQNAGLDALVASVDPTKLKEIDFCFCQSSGNLFRRWEKTPLPSLERLVLRDGVTLSTLSKFLKQYGPEGTCRKLRSLELNCKGLPSLRAVEQGFLEFYDINLYDYPGDTDSDDSFDDEDEFVDEFFDAHGIIAPESPDATSKTKTSKDSLPAPWKAIQDLRGCREEGWGIERLVLDIIPSMRIYDAASLPKQDVFFEGFWALRELVVPVSYDDNLWVSISCPLSSLVLTAVDSVCRNHRQAPQSYAPLLGQQPARTSTRWNTL